MAWGALFWGLLALLISTGCMAQPNLYGPKGDPGLPGAAGEPGKDGSKGARGLSGLKGEPGLPGIPGRDGLEGDPGEKGEKGSPPPPPGIIEINPGIPGPRGPPGDPGHRGRPGPPGFPGIKGNLGLPGLPGAKGVQGPPCPGDTGVKPKFAAFTGQAPDVEKPTTDYQTINLSRVITAIGGGFDPSKGLFRAPIKGFYFFSVFATAEGSGAIPVSLLFNGDEEIVHTARSSETATGAYPLGSTRLVKEMDAGDTMEVKVKAKSGSLVKLFYATTHVTFNGYLIM